MILTGSQDQAVSTNVKDKKFFNFGGSRQLVA